MLSLKVAMTQEALRQQYDKERLYQRQVMAMKLGLAIAYKLPMNVLRKKKSRYAANRLILRYRIVCCQKLFGIHSLTILYVTSKQ